jgi:hypothetical protein
MGSAVFAENTAEFLRFACFRAENRAEKPLSAG